MPDYKAKVIIYYSMESFGSWLTTRLKERDWRPADLARAGDIDNAIISRALSDSRLPSTTSLDKISDALNIPVDDVYRAAGLLPPEKPVSGLRRIALHLFDQMEQGDQERIVDQMKFELERRKKKNGKNRSQGPAGI